MKIYELRCLNKDGHIESNGFYLYLEDAEKEKKGTDNYPMNRKYAIKQSIIIHEVKE